MSHSCGLFHSTAVGLCFLSLVHTNQSIHTLSHKHINRHKHLYEADTAALLNRLDNWPHSVCVRVCVCVCVLSVYSKERM